MESEAKLSAVISGSFKFKPEIDRGHETFADFDVVVLAPDTGWLYVPRLTVAREVPGTVRPLPSERFLPIEAIEEVFLGKLREANFVYLLNTGGYVGTMSAFEIGYAVAAAKPVYAAEALPDVLFANVDVETRSYVETYVQIMDMESAAKHYREHYLR